jgi:hypothetical protein
MSECQVQSGHLDGLVQRVVVYGGNPMWKKYDQCYSFRTAMALATAMATKKGL